MGRLRVGVPNKWSMSATYVTYVTYQTSAEPRDVTDSIDVTWGT